MDSWKKEFAFTMCQAQRTGSHPPGENPLPCRAELQLQLVNERRRLSHLPPQIGGLAQLSKGEREDSEWGLKGLSISYHGHRLLN